MLISPAPEAVRIGVASEFRVEWDPIRGAVTPSPFGYEYWRRVFGSPLPVVLVVRAEASSADPDSNHRSVVAGQDVTVVTLPPLRPRPRLIREIPRALLTLREIDPAVPFVLRMPGIVPSLVLLVLLLRRRPFGVQVVGDPLDVAFAAGIGGRLGPAVGLVLGGATWLACRRAHVVAYVTESYLQRRYPAGHKARTHAISNVRLEGSESTPQAIDRGTTMQLVTVTSLEQPYKRVDLLIEALAVLRREGWPLRLVVAGAGAGLGGLRELAARLEVGEHVRWAGMLDRSALADLYQESDLFVLCSDTEGMPRALLEAAAAGLPCVATNVGGIPEILAADALCQRGSLASLVSALRRNLVSPSLRHRNSTRCRVETERFHPDVLRLRWEAFVADVLRLSSSSQ